MLAVHYTQCFHLWTTLQFIAVYSYRRKQLAQLGSATGVYKTLVKYLVGVPQVSILSSLAWHLVFWMQLLFNLCNSSDSYISLFVCSFHFTTVCLFRTFVIFLF